jgi:DNA-binding NarL/FixJ family response regulator
MGRILIVDDNAVGRMLVSGVLAATKTPGLEIMQAANAAEAAVILERFAIELLVTDLHMNDVGGLQLIKRLRRGGYSLPIVVVTMEESPEVLRKVLEAGASMVLSKRAPASELQKALGLIGSGKGPAAPDLNPGPTPL